MEGHHPPPLDKGRSATPWDAMGTPPYPTPSGCVGHGGLSPWGGRGVCGSAWGVCGGGVPAPCSLPHATTRRFLLPRPPCRGAMLSPISLGGGGTHPPPRPAVTSMGLGGVLGLGGTLPWGGGRGGAALGGI